METLQVIILAVVQGVAEFLPISSSGHLVVLDALFKQLGSHLDTDTITLNIVLHLGTLGAILVVFHKRIRLLLSEDRRVIPLVIVGTLPAVVVGLPLRFLFKETLESPMVAGCMFLVTGAMLIWRRNDNGALTCREMSYSSALLIGVFQAFAILPGVSRSGSTIVAGLLAGLRRDEAAAFSFLLAIPAIGGGGLIEAVKLFKDGGGNTEFGLLALGAFLSFAVGVASLLWLLKWLEQGRLVYFAAWVLLLGPVVIVWRLAA